MTTLVCISDTHMHHRSIELPPGDILIHSGDFTKTGRGEDVEDFLDWFRSQPHTHKVLVAGNHDLTLDESLYRSSWYRWHRVPEEDARIRDMVEQGEGFHYLRDRKVILDGVKIYGSPWQPEFGGWAFNLPRNSNEISSKWASIPLDLDVLVTHGPPKRILDDVEGDSVGCLNLRMSVDAVRPKVHIFGHIHEGYGTKQTKDTYFINASSCNAQYKPVNPPIVYELVK